LKEIILINVAGQDRPGVTSSLTAILAQFDVNVLDIGQAVIHDTLSLGMLMEVPAAAESSSLLKDVLFRCHELGLQVRFTPISAESYDHWVTGQGKPRHIITVLARKITAEHIARVSATVSEFGLNIDRIDRLSGRVPLNSNEKRSSEKHGNEKHGDDRVGNEHAQNKACVEISARGPLDNDEFRSRCMVLASELDIDIAYQEDTMFRRNRRLVAFDMDSTLIDAEVIDELAKAAGVGMQVAAITERAMRGELDFTASFRARVALLKGLDESVLNTIAARLRLNEGAERLVSTLKKMGYKTAILSGGFNYFGQHLQRQLGIDYVFANELEIRDGKVTGEVVGEVVDGQRKAALLREIAAKENISLEQVIAVGDGANDLPMLSIAGLGIAFRAKPIVKQSARQSISTLGLDGILYLLGISDRHAD
jgi:phosphoserine phosphatase